MQAFRGTALLLAVLACGAALGCGGGGSNPVAPSLSSVDPTTVLFTDDFDTENGGKGVFNWTTFANWNVVGGCVDLHGNGFVVDQPGKGLFVDLDGSCIAGGTIETKTAFTLQPGTYVLEFWLAGNQRINTTDTVNVSFGSLYQDQFVLAPDAPFTLRTKTITVSSPTTARIQFQNLGADDRGALLDLVRLRKQ